MIDLIIIAYDNKETIKDTLLSIMLQEISETLNIIVVSNKDDNYTDMLKLFERKLKITEIKEDKKDFSLKNIQNTGEFYVLIKAGDMFYNYRSLKYLYNATKEQKKYITYGINVKKVNNEYEYLTTDSESIYGKMYSKIEDYDKNETGYVDEIIYLYNNEK